MPNEIQPNDSEPEAMLDEPVNGAVSGLRDAVQTLTEGVGTLVKKSFWDRILIRIAIVLSIVSIALMIGLARTSLNTCHVGNAFRQNESQLWNHFLTLPPTHVLTPEEIKQREDAKVYITKLFAQRNCSVYNILKP